MSYKSQAVRLPGRLSAGSGLQFFEALLFESPRLPFAIVNFKQDGDTEELGLRLDLDRQVFLDHFADPGIEAAATAAAPEIVRYLGTRDGAPAY